MNIRKISKKVGTNGANLGQNEDFWDKTISSANRHER